MYYLFSVGLQEKVFELPTVNNAHIAFESILQKYPFLLPAHNKIIDTDIECIKTVEKLVQFGKTSFLDGNYTQILNSVDNFDRYLSDANKLKFLNDTLMILDTTREPYNILKIFSDFANEVTTPKSTVESLTENSFILLLNTAINMYIKNTFLESNDIARPLFEWAYNFNGQLFCSTLVSIPEWTKYFDNNVYNSNLFLFITETILKQTAITHENIFGNNIDDFPSVFTRYAENCSQIYGKLIECGHLDAYYSHNFDIVYNLLCLRDIKITNALRLLPTFSPDVFYESYEDEDLFKQGYNHCDMLYCKYLLETFQPCLEYKKEFVKIFNPSHSPQLTSLLLRTGVINYLSYTSVNEYCNVIKTIMSTLNGQLDDDILTFTTDELDKMFALEVCSDVLMLFAENSPTYVEVIRRQLDSSEQFRKLIKLYENELTTSINKTQNFELTSAVLKHSVIGATNVVSLTPIIIQYVDTFSKILTDFNIVDLMKIEERQSIHINDSFLIKVFDSNDSYKCLLQWASDDNNYVNINMLIVYCLEKGLDILSKFLGRYELSHTEHIVKLLLMSDLSLITNVMIAELIVLDKKDLIIKCVKSKINISTDNINAILEKYPDSVLLFENTKELIMQMNDTNIVALFKSPCMTPDVQDFVLGYLQTSQKFGLMCECLTNIQIQSQFLETQNDFVSKLIEMDNEVFYNLMKNGICVDTYLLTMDTNGNYMLPFIPDGYIDEKLVEKFVSALSLEDLNRCDKFGRSTFNNLVVNPFLKFVLKRPDIDKFYESNQHTLKLLINNIAINHYDVLEEFPSHLKHTIVNQKGQNIPMILLSANKCKEAEDFLMNDADQYTLEHKDTDGCNLLFYAVLQPEVFEDILHMYIRDYGTDCVKVHNENCETLLMYAIRHGVHNSSFEMLLSNDIFGIEQNYVYKNAGSILTYGATYLNNAQFETLLNWKHINGNHLDITQNFELYDWFSGDDPLTTRSQVRGSLLTIASYYNGFILRNILKYYETHVRSIKTILSKEKVIIGNTSYTPIEFTYLYNPESFQQLLGLSYIDELVSSHEFFSKHYSVQPASWFHYTRSKIYTNTIPSMYSMSYYLRPGSHIDSIASIVQAKQECGQSLIDTCNFCNVGKKKIMFGCHLHLACVKCGCMIENCPDCGNKEHSKKIKIFD
jgi:hypothetical protein